jgi:hypothetical protein
MLPEACIGASGASGLVMCTAREEGGGALRTVAMHSRLHKPAPTWVLPWWLCGSMGYRLAETGGVLLPAGDAAALHILTQQCTAHLRELVHAVQALACCARSARLCAEAVTKGSHLDGEVTLLEHLHNRVMSDE